MYMVLLTPLWSHVADLGFEQRAAPRDAPPAVPDETKRPALLLQGKTTPGGEHRPRFPLLRPLVLP